MRRSSLQRHATFVTPEKDLTLSLPGVGRRRGGRTHHRPDGSRPAAPAHPRYGSDPWHCKPTGALLRMFVPAHTSAKYMIRAETVLARQLLRRIRNPCPASGRRAYPKPCFLSGHVTCHRQTDSRKDCRRTVEGLDMGWRPGVLKAATKNAPSVCCIRLRREAASGRWL